MKPNCWVYICIYIYIYIYWICITPLLIPWPTTLHWTYCCIQMCLFKISLHKQPLHGHRSKSRKRFTCSRSVRWDAASKILEKNIKFVMGALETVEGGSWLGSPKKWFLGAVKAELFIRTGCVRGELQTHAMLRLGQLAIWAQVDISWFWTVYLRKRCCICRWTMFRSFWSIPSPLCLWNPRHIIHPYVLVWSILTWITSVASCFVFTRQVVAPLFVVRFAPGDIALAAGFIAYAGPFTAEFRARLGQRTTCKVQPTWSPESYLYQHIRTNQVWSIWVDMAVPKKWVEMGDRFWRYWRQGKMLGSGSKVDQRTSNLLIPETETLEYKHPIFLNIHNGIPRHWRRNTEK